MNNDHLKARWRYDLSANIERALDSDAYKARELLAYFCWFVDSGQAPDEHFTKLLKDYFSIAFAKYLKDPKPNLEKELGLAGVRRFKTGL